MPLGGQGFSQQAEMRHLLESLSLVAPNKLDLCVSATRRACGETNSVRETSLLPK